jgi:hypothetical protein
MATSIETDNDEVITAAPRRIAEPEEPGDVQIGYIPTAAATCRRIAGRLAISGAEYRESHPQLANELAALINGVERGTEVYVANQTRKFNIHEVRQCLDGLGYTVTAVNAMVNNPHVPFTISWDSDGSPQKALLG